MKLSKLERAAFAMSEEMHRPILVGELAVRAVVSLVEAEMFLDEMVNKGLFRKLKSSELSKFGWEDITLAYDVTRLL